MPPKQPRKVTKKGGRTKGKKAVESQESEGTQGASKEQSWEAGQRDETQATHGREAEVSGSEEEDEGENAGLKDKELNDQIAAFFEDRPHFYDTSNEDYKNRRKRDEELQQFASTIGLAGEFVVPHFMSLKSLIL